MKEKYQWKQISQWDFPKREYYREHRTAATALSGKVICTFLLVGCEDQGGGYIRTIPVCNDDVTQEMVDIANGREILPPKQTEGSK